MRGERDEQTKCGGWATWQRPRSLITLGGTFVAKLFSCWSCTVISISSRAIRLPRHALWVLAAAGLVVPSAAVVESADAQAYRSHRTHKAQRAAARPSTDKRDKAAPQQPVHLIVVSIPKQRISLYGAGGFHKQGAVSTGTAGFPTPTGVFSVIQKNRYHRSNIYSGAPMPFMQRITWSGVAMHEGVLPGYPASHGCIRLTHQFASELWGMTRMGVRVIVTPDDAQPAEVAHAKLPTPTMTPVPAAATQAETIKPSLVAMAGEKSAEASGAPKARLVSPLERAKAEKAQMILEAPAKAKAAKEAADVSAAKAIEANRAIKALREAEQALAAARDRQEAAAKAVEQAKTPEAADKAKEALSAAAAKVEEAAKAVPEAAAVEAAKTQEAFAAAQAAWDAEKASDLAAATARAGERATEPISVFVSKKTGRVLVRQAWRTIHDAPATFRDAEAPLGTHVYVATEMVEDGTAMRWLSVTMPQPAARVETRQRGRHGDRHREAAPIANPSQPRETATGALDRVVLLEETRKFIADRLWAGASLIVSEHGLSNEAGKYTDFIVQPR
jgi:lipoprotein-anchoring transpeptidase ErfK/SrfK